ncbi:Uu.00g053760.m01.CDS01 [Anthostomella pinea]|uniref:Uu.00g053760.m01.CDS01 n=1 Tax=Anthostomella pinea TaxID=933095 RepID=A0AAI8VWI3_9PEZI|nr:Uu.00g053760.m01.CDS01 [Anthostomella pinea]
MEPNVTWPMVVGAVIAYYVTVVVYRLSLHPLARFPGPKLAAISRWYEAYYDVLQGGQYTSKIAELHKLYGPIIGISPYELHVIDPGFFETLYCMEGRWDKYGWTYDAFGAKGSTVFGSDKLCQRISTLEGATSNLGAAVSAFSRDSANKYIMGKEYNELDLEDFGIGLSIASQGAGVFWHTTKHVADEGTKAFLRYVQQYERDSMDILAAAMSSSPDNKIQNTIIYEIVRSNPPPTEKAFHRVHEEVATVTGAAYETTANTMRLILYHVYTNDEIIRRLREEIASITTEASEPIALRKLEKLPYLRAVLMEGIRLSPGIATRAARLTNTDLFYGDWRIPAGTPVGMTTLLMHTNEELYPNPMRFDPDRWMNATAQATGGANFAPFSRGMRICLGMYLAWAEMYQLVPALIQRYNFKVEGATAADFELERDNFAIGTKAGCNSMAHVTPFQG